MKYFFYGVLLLTLCACGSNRKRDFGKYQIITPNANNPKADVSQMDLLGLAEQENEFLADITVEAIMDNLYLQDELHIAQCRAKAYKKKNEQLQTSLTATEEASDLFLSLAGGAIAYGMQTEAKLQEAKSQLEQAEQENQELRKILADSSLTPTTEDSNVENTLPREEPLNTASCAQGAVGFAGDDTSTCAEEQEIYPLDKVHTVLISNSVKANPDFQYISQAHYSYTLGKVVHTAFSADNSCIQLKYQSHLVELLHLSFQIWDKEHIICDNHDPLGNQDYPACDKDDGPLFQDHHIFSVECTPVEQSEEQATKASCHNELKQLTNVYSEEHKDFENYNLGFNIAYESSAYNSKYMVPSSEDCYVVNLE